DQVICARSCYQLAVQQDVPRPRRGHGDYDFLIRPHRAIEPVVVGSAVGWRSPTDVQLVAVVRRLIIQPDAHRPTYRNVDAEQLYLSAAHKGSRVRRPKGQLGYGRLLQAEAEIYWPGAPRPARCELI